VLGDDPGVPMSRDELRLLAEVINEHCGIAFGDDMRHLLRRRLSPRLAALGLASFAEYHRYLRYAPGSTAFRYLVGGDRVRLLVEWRAADHWLGVEVAQARWTPRGARGWVLAADGTITRG